MSDDHAERRRFSRIAFDASTEVAQDGQRWKAELQDLSLQGLLVTRPPGWNGWRIVPSQIEFWHDRPFRLHDRIVFTRDAATDPWRKTRLYP